MSSTQPDYVIVEIDEPVETQPDYVIVEIDTHEQYSA